MSQPSTLDKLYSLMGHAIAHEQDLGTEREQLLNQVKQRTDQIEKQIADAQRVGDEQAQAEAQDQLDRLNEAYTTLTQTEEPDVTDQHAPEDGDRNQPAAHGGPGQADAGRPVAGEEPQR